MNSENPITQRSPSILPPQLPSLSPLGPSALRLPIPNTLKVPDEHNFVPITLMTPSIKPEHNTKYNQMQNAQSHLPPPLPLPPSSSNALPLPPLMDDDASNMMTTLNPPYLSHLTFPALNYRHSMDPVLRTSSPSPSVSFISNPSGCPLSSTSPSPNPSSTLNTDCTVSAVTITDCPAVPITDLPFNVIFTKPPPPFIGYDAGLPFPPSLPLPGNDELEGKSESDHSRTDDEYAHSEGDEPYSPDDDLIEMRRSKRFKRSTKASKTTKSVKYDKFTKSNKSNKSIRSKATKSLKAKSLKSSRSKSPKSASNQSTDSAISITKNIAVEGSSGGKSSKFKNSKKKSHRSATRWSKVKPAPSDREGASIIPWNELCRTELLCHFCKKLYTESNGGRGAYVDCLKTHYNAHPDLEYLTCELCIDAPTKGNAKKKEKCNGEGDEWRKCKHAANFISHLAGHSEAGLQPGFVCRVKTLEDGQWRKCGTRSSTRQNLAKHLYNMHYKEGDDTAKYTVIPEHGFVDRISAKELVKPGVRRKNKGDKRTKSLKSAKSKKCNVTSTRRKSITSRSRSSKQIKLEIECGTKRSRSRRFADRQLRSRQRKRRRVDDVKDDEESSLELNEGVPCRTLEDQTAFVGKMARCGYFMWFLDELEGIKAM